MASKKLGQLFVEYRATADQWAADLKRMSQDAKAFENVLKPAREQALALGTGLTAVGGAVSTALVAMSKQAANYGDSLRDASIRTGVTTQQLAGLKLAADQSGASFESMTGGLKILARNAAEAAGGSKATAAVFRQLGIEVKDSSGALRPMGDLVLDVADRFAKMEDGTQKAALAQKLFGRGGLELIETMNSGRAGLEGYQKAAEALGLAMGMDAVNAADQFNDSLNLLKQAQLGLAVSIGQVLLPPLTRLVEMAIGATVAFRKFAAEHPMLIRSVGALAGVLTGAGGLLVGLSGVLYVLPKLGPAFALLLTPVGLATTAVLGLTSAFIAFPQIRGVVSDTIKNIVGTLAIFGSVIRDTATALGQLATGKWLGVIDTIKNSNENAFQAMTRAMDAYDIALAGISGSLNGFKLEMPKLDDLMKDFNVNLSDGTAEADKLREAFFRLQNALRGIETEFQNAIDSFDLTGLIQDVPKFKAQLTGIHAPVKDLTEDAELFGIVLDGIGQSTTRTAEQSARMFAARQKDIENETKLASKWAAAWSTAVGNISSQFSSNIIDTLFPDRQAARDKRESTEKQITSIVREQERERLQAVIDSTRSTSAARKAAEKDLADFNKRMKAEDDAQRSRDLTKLQEELDHQTSLFRKFASGIKNVFMDLGKSILQIFINDVFMQISKHFTALLAKIGPLSKIFGAGGSAAAGAAGSVAGSVGTSIGSTAAAVASSFTPMGLVQAGASIIGPVIGAWMTKGNLKRTEEQTRETRDWLELMATAWNPLFHKSEGWLRMIEENTRKVGPVSAIPQRNTSGSQAVYVTINAPLTLSSTVNLPNATEITAITARDVIAPELMLVYETNVRGYGEKLAQIINGYGNGLTGSEVPVGI